MKKIIFLLLCLFISSAVQAQFIKSYGIKIGGTAANLKWDYAPPTRFVLDTDAKVGFNAGVFAEFLRLPVFSLIAEINYVEKGMHAPIYEASVDNPAGGGERTWKLGLNYLNFSLLGKARLDGIICTPYLIAGPKVDFEINKSETFDDPVFKGFAKTNFGFKVGAGTEVKLFGINFLAEVIYDANLGKLYDVAPLEITSYSFDFRAGAFINL